MELLTPNTGVPVEQFTTDYPRLKQCSNIARKMRLSGWMILVQCTRSTTRSYSQSSKEVFENVGGGAVAVSVREDIAGGKVNNPSDDDQAQAGVDTMMAVCGARARPGHSYNCRLSPLTV